MHVYVICILQLHKFHICIILSKLLDTFLVHWGNMWFLSICSDGLSFLAMLESEHSSEELGKRIFIPFEYIQRQ